MMNENTKIEVATKMFLMVQLSRIVTGVVMYAALDCWLFDVPKGVALALMLLYLCFQLWEFKKNKEIEKEIDDSEHEE